MEEQRTAYRDNQAFATVENRVPVVFSAAATRGVEAEKFNVSSYTLNQIAEDWVDPVNPIRKKPGMNRKLSRGANDTEPENVPFPGNISPEGYFYSQFYEVTLKELDDEVQFVRTRRINFEKSDIRLTTSSITTYNPETGTITEKEVRVISISCYMPYDFIKGQPFCIYDIEKDDTYRGHLDYIKTREDGTGVDMKIVTETEIESLYSGDTCKYIISILDDNAPEYSVFVPSSDRLVWRAPKKMSDLSSESPIYDMPFANGRLYIHKNINVFVRRQDPDNGYKLFRPSIGNPLRRFKVEGNGQLDFDYIKYITDSMINAC